MAAPTLQIAHGDHSTLLLLTSQITENAYDLDSLTATFEGTEAAGAELSKGAAVPGFSGFYVDTYTRERIGSYYLYTVNGLGLATASNRRIKGGYVEDNTLGDWDGYSDRRLATSKGYFTKGARAGNFVCVYARDMEKMPGVGLWECEGRFIGIRSGVGTRRRQVSSNGNVISGDSLIVNLEAGWTTARKGKAMLPKIVVSDTYPSLNPPVTAAVPSSIPPPNAPAIRNIVFNGTDRREVWPSPWVFTCGYDQPFGLGVALYMVTETYESQLRYEPG